MSEAAFKVNAIAAEILAILYKEYDHKPNDWQEKVTQLFPTHANIFQIPEAEKSTILRLTCETIEIFLSQTDWHEYYSTFNGPYAHLINPSVALTQQIARLT